MRHPTVPLSIGLSVGLAVSLLVCAFIAVPSGPASARGQDRTLKLYFGHTGERGEFTYKRNGRYDRNQLERINRFLRDWRKNEPTRIDPHLLDLVWSIHAKTGSKEYIHVVSAYRSPTTNDMLRRRSRGVAKNSQHTQGKAMDFYIPGVPLDKLRAIAMKLQGGGVGYYPRSGSPFVHADTGSVRAWPRMSRQQLLALFPNGETLHLPADGKPLPGYERAVASRKAGGATTLAYLETESEATDRTGTGGTATGWLKRVFGGGADQAEDDAASGTPTLAETPVAPDVIEPQLAAAAPAELAEPRTPRVRPGSATGITLAGLPPAAADEPPAEVMPTLAFAPLPRTRPDPGLLAGSLGAGAGAPLAVASEDALAALAVLAGGPVSPQPERNTEPEVQVAYAPPAGDGTRLSHADRAILAGFAAIGEAEYPPANDAAPVPPAAAPAPDGTRTAAEDEDALRLALARDAARIVSAAASGGQIVVVPSPRNEQDGAGGADRLLTTPAAQDPRFARFDMPEPEAVRDLYAAPTMAYEVPGASTPADGFQTAAFTPPADEKSFFARLFASLVE